MVNSFNPLALQSESVTLNFPIQSVYSAVISTVEETKNFKLREENRILFRISIQTKVSAFSWGELLTVQLNDEGYRTRLTISSQNKTAIGSLGVGAQATIGRKNKKNIDLFLRELSKHLH